jgi:hypothetical protein
MPQFSRVFGFYYASRTTHDVVIARSFALCKEIIRRLGPVAPFLGKN